jgi:hypothetical protein
MVTKSRYVVEFLPTTDFEDRDVIAFIAKRTYKLDTFEGRLEPLEEQPPIAMEDEPHDDGEVDSPSVRVEADFVPFKPRADIVLLGKAYAPGGAPAKEFTCGVRVGPYRKQLRIVGPRRCSYVPVQKQPKIDKKTGLPKEDVVQPPPAFGEPEPVTEVELRLKNAYGGWSYVVPDDPEAYKKALEDIEKKKEEDKKAEEEAKKKAEEEAKKKAEEEKKKPESKFSGAPEGAQKGADGALRLDPNAPIEDEPEEQKNPTVDVTALRAQWGKVGTAGEAAKGKDGATRAIDLSALDETLAADEIGSSAEAAYRKSTAAGAVGAAGAAVAEADGHTRALRVGDMVEAEDASWADRERDQLADADRAKRAAEEEARKKAAQEKELPYPKVTCPQNPVGKGFAIHNLPETIDGLELPLIEDPARPIRPEDIPRELSTLMDEATIIFPAGVGFFPKGWWPRTAKSGVMPRDKKASQAAVDEQIAKLDPKKPLERAQAEQLVDFEVPLMKPEYHSGAMPGLQVEKLVGDEDVVLTNLCPQGTTAFKLPGDYPHVTLDRGRGKESILVRLDTLVIDRENEQVSLVWRGVLPYGGVAEFETYRRFDIDVKESAIDVYKDALAEEARKKREEEHGTKAIDISELEASAEARYREHVDGEAGGRAKAAAVASGAAVVVEGGTRMLDLAELGGEKVVTDDQFHAWADDAPKGEEPPEDDPAVAAAKKKAALKKKLAELKEKEAQEAAAAAAAEEAAASKKKK